MVPRFALSQIIKSDFFYHEHGINHTLQDLQRDLIQSLNRCATKNGQQVTLHLILSKGDWKWKQEWLLQERYYNNGINTDLGLCPRCLAAKGNWLDPVHEAFNAPADILAARATSVGPNVAVRELAGWTPESEVPDLLHVVWLGTGRDLVGSLCMEAAELSAGDGVTYDERFITLRRSMQKWCLDRNIRASVIEELTLAKLGVKTLSLDYPQGPSKGYANKVMVAFFADQLRAAWLPKEVINSGYCAVIGVINWKYILQNSSCLIGCRIKRSNQFRMVGNRKLLTADYVASIIK